MNTHFRTLAKRRRALARSLKVCTKERFLEQLYESDRVLPSPQAVNNYYMKVGTQYFILSCTERPDEGLRRQAEKHPAVIEGEEEQRIKTEQRKAWHAGAADRRREAAAIAA